MVVDIYTSCFQTEKLCILPKQCICVWYVCHNRHSLIPYTDMQWVICEGGTKFLDTEMKGSKVKK